MGPPRKSKKDDDTSDSGPDDIDEKPAAKKAKTSRGGGGGGDDEENSWQLDKKRFLKVREFKGKLQVDIREYYEADGELKPGRKGICLSMEQWKKLCNCVQEVNDAIKNM